MAINQNAHLHPACWIKTPPTTGPTIGPRMGPIAQNAIAFPLSSTGIRSAIVPLPHVTAATPANPDKNRNAINIPMFFETAQQMVKMRNSTLHAWYTGRRPYSSLKGARTRGPKAKPSTKTETTKVARRGELT